MRAGELPVTFSVWRDCGAMERRVAAGAWVAQQRDTSTQPELGCDGVSQPDEQQSDGGTHESAGWMMPERHTRSISAATNRRFTETPSPAASPEGHLRDTFRDPNWGVKPEACVGSQLRTVERQMCARLWAGNERTRQILG